MYDYVVFERIVHAFGKGDFFSKYKSLLSTRLFLMGRIVAELVEHLTQLLISGS